MSEKINFGNVAQEYAKYRDQLPEIIFEQFRRRDIVFQGKKVMDLGAGSGIFSRAIAGQGAEVLGVEPEINLINAAKVQDQIHNYSISYLNSAAEEINLPNHSFDIVTALRAWHWFDRDKVLEEVKRLLKSEGYLIVIHAIFVPHLSEEAQQTLDIIRSSGVDMKPAGSMAGTAERRNGFPTNWFEEWEAADLQVVDEWQNNYDLSYTIDEWCGKVKSLSWLTNAEQALKDKITRKIKISLGHKPLIIPHQYSVVLLRV
jgi:ubiquinone/menaquinone biosynthesis C-methylase UbiE